MKEKILALLREQNGYVSGQDICEQLGISRTAVWKYIHMLEGEGYEIESVRKRGYRFVKAPDCLSAAEIASQLETQIFAKPTLYYDEIDSTNEEVKRLAEQGAAHGTLAVADYQSKGKGRRGRQWISPRGNSVYMSILLRPDMESKYASGLTLVCALAVAAAIDCVGCETKIKWPNDVIINGKKVCGILTEMSSDMEYINYIVIGIGININGDKFSKEIAKTATSIERESGKKINRAKLVADVMKNLEKYYALYLKTRDLSLLLELYNEKLINRDEKVRLLQQGKEEIRTALGIDKKGALLVRDDEGNIESVISGEVSVRGVYGYAI